jgi:hypothetical protein
LAYTTRQEIEADFKDTNFTTTSNVRIKDVEQFIVESDALINAYVGTVYTVPVTTAGQGLSLLKLLSRSLTATRVKAILKVKQETASKDANQNVLDTLLSTAQVMKILRDIQEKTIALEGASALTSGGGFYSNNVNEDVEPVITKEDKLW